MTRCLLGLRIVRDVASCGTAARVHTHLFLRLRGRLYPGLLKTVAVGHIVSGYRQRQPTYIKMAAAILKQLQQPSSRASSSRTSGAASVSGTPSGVLLLQGVCQLLLGEVQAATGLLKQAEAARCGTRVWVTMTGPDPFPCPRAHAGS